MCGRHCNPEKFTFGRKEVEIAGFELKNDGYRPTKTTLNAIKSFPVPNNITDVRAWFGLVDYRELAAT